MNQALEALKSTTFAGKRFTRKQLAQIQQTVHSLPNLSRSELGHTICEHLHWVTPKGKPKIQTCLNALEEMEKNGLFVLPKKTIPSKKRKQREIIWTEKTEIKQEIEGSLEQFSSIEIRPVLQKESIDLWNEYIDRYHYLGYRRPIGTHLRYFIVAQCHDNEEKILGGLLFSFPTWSLACRDQWIGWEKDVRQKHLKLILNNNRFLIFPWVKIKNLASKSLSLVANRISDDWVEHHGFRPVLLETFIDPEIYTGTCYKAANWHKIGATEEKRSKSSKEVYVYPLSTDYKSILNHEKQLPKLKKMHAQQTRSSQLEIDDPFILLWQRIVDLVIQVADSFDLQWQKRKRVLNTLLLIFFIFRLVFSKNKQGYGSTVVELWDQCRLMNLPLPQTKPVAASALCSARNKLNESIFKTLNTRIIDTYEDTASDYNWMGRRLFAVDGSKINLPHALIQAGYTTPNENTHYPQGLVSCLYQLKSQIPYDFDLVTHDNERTASLSHLLILRQDDIVIYDRGYFSYAMLYYHNLRNIDAVFRLAKNSYKVIDDFMESALTDQVVILHPSAKRVKEITDKYHDIKIIPLKIRLIKYTISENCYYLGTTIIDSERYAGSLFADLYHSRWGIEELYKISKLLIDVEDFHAKTERGVKQELFAHFVLITLNRIFTNHSEQGLNRENSLKQNASNVSKFKVNTKNSLIAIARNLESLFMQQVVMVKKTINRVFNAIAFCKQKVRPNRAYARKSMKTIRKWRPTHTKEAMKSPA